METMTIEERTELIDRIREEMIGNWVSRDGIGMVVDAIDLAGLALVEAESEPANR